MVPIYSVPIPGWGTVIGRLSVCPARFSFVILARYTPVFTQAFFLVLIITCAAACCLAVWSYLPNIFIQPHPAQCHTSWNITTFLNCLCIFWRLPLNTSCFSSPSQTYFDLSKTSPRRTLHWCFHHDDGNIGLAVLALEWSYIGVLLMLLSDLLCSFVSDVMVGILWPLCYWCIYTSNQINQMVREQPSTIVRNRKIIFEPASDFWAKQLKARVL